MTIRISSWDEHDVSRRITEAEGRGYILQSRGGGVEEKNHRYAGQKYWAVMRKGE